MSTITQITEQRATLLKRLNALTPEDWLRSAIVTGAARPLHRSVQFYAQRLAKHERSHLKQFRQLEKHDEHIN